MPQNEWQAQITLYGLVWTGERFVLHFLLNGRRVTSDLTSDEVAVLRRVIPDMLVRAAREHVESHWYHDPANAEDRPGRTEYTIHDVRYTHTDEHPTIPTPIRRFPHQTLRRVDGGKFRKDPVDEV